MAVLFCWFSIILVFCCAVLFVMHRRKLACWLLIIFPAALCIGLFMDLAHGAARLGEASYRTDLRTLPYLLGFFFVTLAAALRPRWSWLFWIAWLFSAFVSAVVVFLTYFWKVFS